MFKSPSEYDDAMERNARLVEYKLLKMFAMEQFRCDSLEGISEYWLPAEPSEALRQGLQHLVDCGLVRRFGEGPEALYMAVDPRIIRNMVKTIDGESSDDAKQEDSD